MQSGPSLLVANVQTMDRQIELTLLKERLVTLLSVAFGGLALLLACVGLYGTLAYAVARRTNELGVRMALGATRGETMWLVLREGSTVAVTGIAIGVPVMLMLARVVRGLLYGVEPLDPLALGATALFTGRVHDPCRAHPRSPRRGARSHGSRSGRIDTVGVTRVIGF